MVISVNDETKELLIQTVSLARNLLKPTNLYLFRCPYCSTGVTQIQGVVNRISEGLDPTEEVVVLHQCRNCKRLYTFQTIDIHKDSTQVTLIGVIGAIGVFYCWLCRNRILQFTNGRIVKLPDFSLIHIPFTMQCVNPVCPAKYRIIDLIER